MISFFKVTEESSGDEESSDYEESSGDDVTEAANVENVTHNSEGMKIFFFPYIFLDFI